MADTCALDWINQIEKTIIAMNGRPLSQKQRSAVLGTLLTLDPSSPFFVSRQFHAAKATKPITHAHDCPAWLYGDTCMCGATTAPKELRP